MPVRYYTQNLIMNDMTNLEKYNSIFTEVFGVAPSALGDSFNKDSVEQWDSVHQLNLVSLAEEIFDVMLDPEDIMKFTSYTGGKLIIRNQGVEI